ncbi:Ig-like domain-containing protein [Moorena sp. SIO3A2]|uniref:calcium-binding protein n=1 Tax=Moorena sp. SIO3A2 TaxID=2607841 RepID=UPI0013B6F52B|nr:Ig-like domain-containing protein [Moorena sp. SIO3A2]NER92226.1 hypothetical protein [Moorena sp. SIO3A2]
MTLQDDFFQVGQADPFQGNFFADNGSGADNYVPGEGETLLAVISNQFIPSNTLATFGNGSTFIFQENGDFVFDPNGAFDFLEPGEEGTPFEFTYSYFNESNRPTVSGAFITIQVVREAPTAPIAQSDVFSIAEDGQVFASLFDDNGNGRDEGDGPLTPTFFSSDGTEIPQNQEVVLESGATVTLGDATSINYQPNGAFDSLNDGETFEEEVFTYTLTDGNGLTSEPAEIRITVNGEGTPDPVDPVDPVDPSPITIAPIREIIGNNEITLGTSSDDILTGTSQADAILGLGGADVIRGLAGRDTLGGGGGRDSLFGGQGRDYLDGGGGQDQLNGGAGRDILVGGNGSDVLSGGKGRDLFVLQSGENGVDTIEDFQDTSDRIALVGYDLGQIEAVQDGSSTSIQFAGTEIASLTGVDASLITDEDFVLV